MARKIIKNISPIEIKNPKQIDLLSPWSLKKISKVECIRKVMQENENCKRLFC